MKRFTIVTCLWVVVMAGGVAAWKVAAQDQKLEDVFTDWQYPSARFDESMKGKELQAIHLQTSDSIAKVWNFYQQKVGSGAGEWSGHSEPIQLAFPEQSGGSRSTIWLSRDKPASGMLVVHRAKETTTVYLSRKDKETTDIVVLVDAH